MKIKKQKTRFESVMLIDDNELDNFINEKVMEASMFASKIYSNVGGKGALEFMEKIAGRAEECTNAYPKVIFVDLNMPLFDGFRFLREFRESEGFRTCNPALVVLTSSSSQSDRERVLEISRDILFLNKPLTPKLLDLVELSSAAGIQ